MKKILLTALFASISLIAADSTPVKKGGVFMPADGAALYAKHCALCHGQDGRKVPDKEASVLAGRDAVRLALTIRAYRDQDVGIGAFTMHKNSQMMKEETSKLSDREIVALAKYISGL